MQKFLLLSWKNWLLQWRHPVQTVGNVLLPLIFCIIVMVIRSMCDPVEHEAVVFPKFNVSDNAAIFNGSYELSELIWSPCNNTKFQRVMAVIAQRHNMTLRCAHYSDELEKMLVENIHNTFAGVDFGDHSIYPNNISKMLEVVLRFPGELRVHKKSDGTIRTWHTDTLYEEIPIPGPRNHTEPTGPDPNYYQEGFLTLQYEISKEILIHHLKRNKSNDLSIPTISMRRFPYPAWFDDQGLVLTREAIFVSLYFMLIPLIMSTVKNVAEEKEKDLKEVMMIMGLPNILHWLACLFKTFVTLLIIMAFVVFFFTVPGAKVLTYSNPFLIYIFLMLYATAIITFCFLVSTFFSKVKLAVIAALVLWYVAFVPFTSLKYKNPDVWTKMFAMLGMNSAVCFGFALIMKFEEIGQGLQYNNVFFSPTVDYFTMGHVFAMLLFDIILYFILALYFEGLFPGNHGVAKKLCYPCTGHGRSVPDQDRRIPESDTYQRGPVHTRTLIKIRNLTKMYHNQIAAVQNLSMDIFEGQITVLLGENGSGKTTTLLMLTGTIPPTSGTIIVNGLNLATRKKQIRNSMCFGPQQAVLFDHLTVREHIYFFSRLKGIEDKEEIDDEIVQYLELLDLMEQENKRVVYLTEAMKRKVSLAITLCGKSKLYILDEPTSGMDPVTRRVLWNFIISLKMDRTFLISTKSINEAEYLGDRVALLFNGQLQCYGSKTFLKQKYGAGYHLIIEKMPNCDIKKVTDFLKRRIPSIKVINNLSFRTTFLLDKHDSVIFSNLLADLESHIDELRIYSYDIAMNTMDEVLVRLKLHDLETDAPDLKADKALGFEKMMRFTGYALHINQFIALMLKKATLSVRSWITLVILILFPVCSLILTYLTSESRKLKQQNKLYINLYKYRDPIVVVTSWILNNSYIFNYLKLMEEESRRVIVWKSKMVTKLLKEANASEINYRKRFVIGASFLNETNTLTAWFSNQPYHSSPLSLQYLMNAILRTKLSEEYVINFVHYPLPYTTETKISKLVEIYTNTLEIPCTIGIAVAIVSALYVMCCIKERITNSKHLQFVSGVSINLYWLCTFLWDFCTFLVASVCIIFTLFVIRIEGFLSFSLIGPLLLLFISYGLAMLPMMYIFSRFFHTPLSAFSVMALINMLIGPITFVVYQNFTSETVGPKSIYDISHWISLLVPAYALTSGVFQLSYKSTLYKLCNIVVNEAGTNNTTTIDPDMPCQVEKKCCDLDQNYLEWNNYGIGSHICFLILVAILLIIILLICEHRAFYSNKSNKKSYYDYSMDKDVLDEKEKIRRGELNAKNRHILLHDLTKFYDKKLVLNQLCVGVNYRECFGLLGAKGAGKTTILKILAGATHISDGVAWIHGWDVNNNIREVLKNIGYCPEADAVLDDLTGKETLMLHCMLRGIALRDCKMVAQVLARELGFENQLNMLILNYTFTTKRKLSFALALIGDPPVLLFDEPTAGIDPPSKRKLWNMIIRQKNNGKSIIITSQNIEECEAVCTKLAVVVNGTLKCLGAPRYLKHKFSLGYTLTIKMMTPDYSTDYDNIDVEPVMDFVKENFPVATLKEYYQNTLIFFIISKSMKWSAIFDVMEQGKRLLNIEDYIIAQSSLEQMILQYTKLQDNE